MYRHFGTLEPEILDTFLYPDYDDLIANLPDSWEKRPNLQNGIEGLRLNATDVGCHPSSGDNPGGVTIRPNEDGTTLFGCYSGCTSWEVWQALAYQIGW